MRFDRHRERPAFYEFRRDDSALALTLGYRTLGYWAVGALEILRLGWGLVQLVRVQNVYGPSICGLPLGSYRIARRKDANA